MIDDDTLERALFALPLDEPPAGHRDRILAATVFAPERRPVVAWEAAIVGTAIAVMVWLLAVVVAVPASGAAIADGVAAALRVLAGFATPGVALWLAIGGAAAFWTSQLTLLPVPQRGRRAP